MGERTNEINDYASSEPERDTSFLQTGAVNEFSEGFKPDYSLSENTADDTGDNTEAETEAIREDIEQTRSQMAQTVNEIQERLTPHNIVEQVKETAKETASEAIENVKQTVRDATVGKVENMVNNVSESARETSSGLVGLIKENPIPAALAGLGLGWLYMKRQGNSSQNRPQAQATFAVPTAYLPSYPYNYSPSTAIPVRTSSTPAAFYNSTATSTNSGGLVDKIMQNPIPAAVAGLSLGYIFMKGQGQGSSNTGYSSYNSQSGLGQVKDNVTDAVGQAGHKVGDIASRTAGAVGDAASTAASTVGDVASTAAGAVGDAASTAAGAVGDIASGAVGKVGDIASGAGDVAGNVVGGVQQGAQKATTQLERMLQDNPLMVGGATLVLGAFIGMMLPATEKENQIFGKAHDTVMEKAGEAVHQTLDKVGSVTDEAANTLKEEAKNQGLTK
jgi:hypothetical protein